MLWIKRRAILALFFLVFTLPSFAQSPKSLSLDNISTLIRDGVTPNRDNSGIDAQLWPLLLTDAPETWRVSLRYVEEHYAVKGGFDFNEDRDGNWWEGTAQAALVYRALDGTADADRLLAKIGKQLKPGGFIRAASWQKVTTGLALSPKSAFADFYYYGLPHLGATAWAALAAIGWNPFTGRKLDDR